MTSWVDRHGDVWRDGDDGLLHSPETRPFPRDHVERKWGPLRPVPDPVEQVERRLDIRGKSGDAIGERLHQARCGACGGSASLHTDQGLAATGCNLDPGCAYRTVVDEILATTPEGDGWDDVDVDRLRAAAVEAIAWSLLDQTMDTADREPSADVVHGAMETAERMWPGLVRERRR